jgi:integrase
MSRKNHLPGLYQRPDGYWQIDKRIAGYGSVRESTGTKDYPEAERRARARIAELENAVRYGVRLSHTFAEAAERYLLEHGHKRALDRDARALASVLPWIGALALEDIHMGTLAPWLRDRRGVVKAATVNRTLAVVRRILHLAARLWRDDTGKTWLPEAPLLQLLPLTDARPPRPITWAEQRALVAELPAHLARMVLFALHTGCREREITQLRWAREYRLPALGGSVFVLPGDSTKNGEERVIPLNAVARSVIDGCRGQHPEFVFVYDGQPVARINNSAWRRARARLGLEGVRVHDLRHTFGMRLRAAGVSLEDRQDLLGHKSGRITTHYSAAELGNLQAAVEKVAEGLFQESPNLLLIRETTRALSR